MIPGTTFARTSGKNDLSYTIGGHAYPECKKSCLGLFPFCFDLSLYRLIGGTGIIKISYKIGAKKDFSESRL